jgi:RNA-dependent RNA polymerase
MQNSVQISREMIINLSENGVSPDVFTKLFCQSMHDTISPLLDWNGQDAMPQLWANVSQEGNVVAGRIARESAWTARARGLQDYDHDASSEDEEVDSDISSSHSTAWWGDDISGCPSGLEETVMTFLDSGFHPATNPILAEKLRIIAKKAVKSCMSKYRVTVPMSCSALIVPGMLPSLNLSHTKIYLRCIRSARRGRNSC